MKKLAAALAALCVAACTQQPSQPVAPAASAPPPAPAAAAPPPSAAQVAPGKWDVTKIRCSDLLGASDEDRASAAMFYYGYLSARAGIRVIDVSKISDNIHRVMVQCGATPSMTVPQAFQAALGAHRPKQS
ncbi:MAG TPA: HdeA/HdeB family chaperone [Stellaceae bacterium]|nr:HdeA/HdeB family chaperone [Stellaceae bacterium]